MWKIAGVLFVMTGMVSTIGLIAGINMEGAGAFAFVMGLFAIIFFTLGFCLFRIKTRKLTPQEKEASRRATSGWNAGGLPVARGASCGICFTEDCLAISSCGTYFRISYDKITDMRIRTDTDVEHHFVSSAGGAVAGGMLYGPAGARIGGRIRKIETKRVQHYLIITYLEGGAIRSVSILCSDHRKISKLIPEFSPRFSAQGQIVDL